MDSERKRFGLENAVFDNGILSLKSVGMAEKEGKKGELTKIWGNDSTACIFEWVKVVKKIVGEEVFG